MKLKPLFFLSFLIIICSNTYAQEGDKLGSWYVYNGFFNISPKVEIFAETQWRTWEPIANSHSFFYRAFLNYNLTSNFQLGISQERHSSWTHADEMDDKIKSEEYRVTLQSIVSQKIDRVSIQHRYRYEFRFLDEKGKQRTRYRLQLGIPITSNKMEKGVVFATVGNEFMVNTQKQINLSQMRTYGMIGYQLAKTTHLQFGYMYISRPVADNLHRLQFMLTQKFSFYD